MNYPENKMPPKSSKKKSYLIHYYLLFAGILLNICFIPVTNAATYNCDSLNHPEKITGKILTITEEPIGTSSSTSDYTILNCFRVTNCTSNSQEGEPQCIPQYVSSCTSGNGSSTYCQPVQAYFADSGAGLLYAYVGNIYRWSAGIIGIITVFYMVLGGIEVAASNGDSGRLEKAKERIMQSIAGLVLLFLSGLLLYTINPNFFTK